MNPEKKARTIKQLPEIRFLLICKTEERNVFLSAPIDCASVLDVKTALKNCPRDCLPGIAIALVERVTTSRTISKNLMYKSSDGKVHFDSRVVINDEELKLWRYDLIDFVLEDTPLNPLRRAKITSLKLSDPEVLYLPFEVEAWWY